MSADMPAAARPLIEPPSRTDVERGRYDGAPSLMAMVALCQPGGVSMVTTPALLSAFSASARYSSSQAASFGSAELAGMTIGLLATSLIIGRMDRRHLALLAILTAVAGHLATLYAFGRADYLLTLGARLLAGLGEGVVSGVAVATIAGSSQPDRAFGLAIPGNLILGALVFALMPAVMRAGGLPVLLAAMAAYSVLFGLTIPWLPRRARDDGAIPSPAQPPPASRSAMAPGLLGLGATLIFLTGIGTVWPITAQIGHAHGFDAGVVARALSIAGFAGAAAGLVAGWIGVRFGRLAPLALGALGVAATMLLLGAPLSQAGFCLALVGLMVWWIFSLPFYFGALAAMDTSGRLVTVSTALQAFGLALGQALAIGLATLGGYSIVVWAGAALVVVAAGLMAWAMKGARIR